jgi:hypothetical protein
MRYLTEIMASLESDSCANALVTPCRQDRTRAIPVFLSHPTCSESRPSRTSPLTSHVLTSTHPRPWPCTAICVLQPYPLGPSITVCFIVQLRCFECIESTQSPARNASLQPASALALCNIATSAMLCTQQPSSVQGAATAVKARYLH